MKLINQDMKPTVDSFQVGHEALKPIIEVLQSGELSRPKTHCGAPATDYVESVQVIVFSMAVGVLLCGVTSFVTLRRYLRV